MRAVAFETHGGLEVLKLMDLPTPKPHGDEVLVQVKACALNHLDIWVRRGLGVTIPMPHIGGCEVTGIVAELGPLAKDSGLTVGQKVMIAPGLLPVKPSVWTARGDDNIDPTYVKHGMQTQGGFAEYSVARACDVLPISDTWSFAEWASVPLTMLTAWNMLHTLAKLQPGETVLIMGAASGVGVAGVQIAKLAQARIIAVAGSADKLAKTKELGADHLINYKEQDVAKEVKKITGGQGVDVVFEHVGAALWQHAMRSMAIGGRLVTCGATTGPKVEIDLRFFFSRQYQLLGCHMGSRADLLRCLDLVERKLLVPVVDKTYPLEETRAAQERLETMSVVGKVVVTV
ncbi:MAG: zinc-binding dehydrogenase [Planctomycetia bacterium]|nr:zinc-binding dehydrogenase [Planctomycetia bacterium]